MSGVHNLRIYSLDDNPFCKECKADELIKSAYSFKEGAYLCWAREGIPTRKGCKRFEQITSKLKRLFKEM